MEDIQYRHKRVKKDPEAIEDVYDGLLYKQCVESGFLDSPTNITMQFNTDGVALWNSSKYSLWPVFLRINELPPVLR